MTQDWSTMSARPPRYLLSSTLPDPGHRALGSLEVASIPLLESVKGRECFRVGRHPDCHIAPEN